jgi:hypothetical protein
MIKTTPIAFSVHNEHENPVYGETATIVEATDEAAGLFFTVRQTYDNIQPGEVRLTMEELEAVYRSAKKLMKEYE